MNRLHVVMITCLFIAGHSSAQQNSPPQRKGKVVVVGSPGRDYFPVHVDKNGEPIASLVVLGSEVPDVQCEHHARAASATHDHRVDPQ